MSPPSSVPLPRASWLGVGVGIAGLVLGLAPRADHLFDPPSPGWLDAAAEIPLYAGMILAGLGVSRSPRDSRTTLLLALTGLCAYLGTHPEWDGIRVAMFVVMLVSVAAAVLLVMPSKVQRVAISLFLFYHFIGIGTAITSPQPSPWWSSTLWVKVFRPHLTFWYTNNAYQFYSPQPGPASLVWFLIEGQGGAKEWYKLPRRPEPGVDPMGVEYFRRLSLTEQMNQNTNLPMGVPPAALARRNLQSDIPLHPEMTNPVQQYRPPQDHSRRMIESYVQHLAAERGGATQVKSIRVYRVLHRLLEPKEFREKPAPFDPTTYLPYYMGEYDAQGVLLVPKDPMLYWLVPIYRTGGSTPGQKNEGELLNYVTVHAGSDPLTAP